jgi:predicted metalloprotease with PDZ domain
MRPEEPMRRLVVLLAILFSACLYGQSGPIQLDVDATTAAKKILHAHLTIPASPGPLTLCYPRWIPGLHEPAGPLGNLTGLRITSGGKTIPWRRDQVDMFAFHAVVPDGARQIEADLDYIEPSGGGGPAAGAATDKLLVLNWYQVLLYPAGQTSDKVRFSSKLRLPAGWKFGTALPVKSAGGDTIAFQETTLERIVDSPLVAGEYFRAVDITPNGEPIHHEIDIVADSEAALAMGDEVRQGFVKLIAESGKLFGTRHYREYHFLLTLSDHTAHFGVEHHESNDSRLPERVFLSPGAAREAGGLLAHEFAHSWSGKFRRPRDLATADLQTPMQTDLLWVYEGNTSFLGDLLAARSGLFSADDYRQTLADSAASLGPGRPGRRWRPLLDTAVAIPAMMGGPGWSSWRRGSDYYQEGELIWLEVASIIHQQSGGSKSIEDFLRSFYGGPNNGPEVKPYTFDELVSLLNQVVPYDWAQLLHERLESTSPEPPLRGIVASGWQLQFSDQQLRGGRTSGRPSPFVYSLGLVLAADGTVTDSLVGGVASGMKVLGVNGRLYKPDLLDDAIAAARNNTSRIELLVAQDEYYRTYSLDYHDGAKFPRLVRDDSRPDYLGELMRAQVQP